ncbi:hypothetical protein L345_15724, partial [Ophiophagus hannah]
MRQAVMEKKPLPGKHLKKGGALKETNGTEPFQACFEGSNYTISIKMLEAARGTQMQRLVISDGLGGPIHSIILNQTSDALGNILAFVLIHLDSLV